MTVPSARSPLTAHLYHLDYPRSLGVYTTYEEVQAVVDALADADFPVQHTMIVGTDLKLIERVTGRKTWPRVIGGGVVSGLWMGLFVGVLFMLLGRSSPLTLVSTALMGAIFFGVWSAVAHAATGGKRDFTSMLATIPMQYELMIEHTHAAAARELLAQQGAAPAPVPPAPRPDAPRGEDGPGRGGGSYGTSDGRGRYGTSSGSHGTGGSGSYGTTDGRDGYGTRGGSGSYGTSEGSDGSPPGAGSPTATPNDSTGRPSRPSFGLPAQERPSSTPRNESGREPEGGQQPASPEPRDPDAGR